MKYLILFLLFSIVGCSSNKDIDNNIEVIIDYGASYRYDLKNDIYTIFSSTGPPKKIEFKLSLSEKREIINEYYSLGISNFPDSTVIMDKCLMMPKILTTIHVVSKDFSQKIQIDMGCNNFVLSDSNKAKKVKRFIKIVKSILYSKPAIRNAPKSDIFYL